MVEARVKCPYEGEYYLMSIPAGYEVIGTHAEDGPATTSWGREELKMRCSGCGKYFHAVLSKR